MRDYCPICKNKDVTDLTPEVGTNEYFDMYFRKYIFCPTCEKYMFIRDKKKMDAME